MKIEDIKKVVVWGLKPFNHTSSYVHYAIYHAFLKLGYDAYWFNDETDNLSDFDFSNTLFYTLGGHENNIPLLKNCLYILHNCDVKKYINAVGDKNVLVQQVYTHNCKSYNVKPMLNEPKCHFYSKFTIFQPWATNLFPDDIDEMINNLSIDQRTEEFAWVGTLATNVNDKFNNYLKIEPFITECAKNDVNFNHKVGLSMEENQTLISKSKYAPALCGEWQCDVGYIPCRAFKNVSYGHLLATNSKATSELFDVEGLEDCVLYSENSDELVEKIKKSYEDPDIKNKIIKSMIHVKNNHTYIQWIQRCLNVFDMSIEGKIDF
jgi:hypothetical protein